MKISDYIQIQENTIRRLEDRKNQAIQNGNLEEIDNIDVDINNEKNTLSKLKEIDGMNG